MRNERQSVASRACPSAFLCVQQDQQLTDMDLIDLVVFGRTILGRCGVPVSHKVSCLHVLICLLY